MSMLHADVIQHSQKDRFETPIDIGYSVIISDSLESTMVMLEHVVSLKA